jgi:DNA repair exonuclease SbcCD nuclease subunit
MLVANFADLHFGKIRLGHTAAQWTKALETCAERGVSVVTVAGDIVEKSNVGLGSSRHLYSTGEIVEQIKKPMLSIGRGLEFVFVAGDHDAPGASGRDCLSVFDGMPNVTCMSQPGFAPVGDIRIFCFPWSWRTDRNAEEELKALLETEDFHGDLFSAHLMVHLAMLSKGRTLDEAGFMNKGGGRMTISRETLDRIAERFGRINLGDFHGRHDLTDGKGGYNGALCQTTMGERDNPAGFEIWNSADGAIEYIELHEAPRYRRVTVRSNEELSNVTIQENQITEIVVEGFEPHRDVVTALERPEMVEVVHTSTPPERTTRLDEVPAGILDRPHDILDMSNASQAAPAEGDELAALHTELDWLLQDVAAVVEATIDTLFPEEATA